MMQMLPMARALAAKGHRVMVALRQLERAASVFGTAGVAFLQAPAWNPVPGARRIRRLETFTQLMVNVGFGDEGELYARACAWRNLFRMAKPDLVVFDHSPTALLASRGLPMRRALIGSGFCCPPAGDADGALPWGLLRPRVTPEAARHLLAVEENVLGRVNRVLARWKEPAMERLGRLYSETDETFLTTLPELEQYPRRPRGRQGRYWGPVLGGVGGAAPAWPAGEGPRVFAYLKCFDGLPGLMAALKARGWPTVVYLDGAVEPVRAYECETLRVGRRRLDMARAARECDAAVLHGGQGATAAVLLAGKPVLLVPLVLEQRLTAAAVGRLGAGLVAPAASRAEDFGATLDALLAGGGHADAARRLAAKYAAFDPAAQVGRMVGRVEGLAARARKRRGARAGVLAG